MWGEGGEREDVEGREVKTCSSTLRTATAQLVHSTVGALQCRLYMEGHLYEYTYTQV